MKVIYKADFTSPSGYSRAARAHAKALIEAGVDVLCEDHKHDSTSIPPDPFWQTELPVRLQRHESAPIKIWHETPEFYAPSPAHLNVAMLAWETSEIPKWSEPSPRHNWVAQINKMQACWTFCHFAKRAMEQSGVTIPISVIPHPIDTEIYRPAVPDDGPQLLYDQHRRPLHEAWFSFLSVFQWTPRKNPSALLLAYLSEFRPEDQAALILKTYADKAGDIALVQKQIQASKKLLRLPHGYPRIFLVPGLMSDHEMAALLRSCDVMVNTSRGEGFCLPTAEALACALPVIVPDGSAFKDYVTENHGYLVKCHTSPVYGMPHIPWYFGTQTWHDVDVMHLRERMREAYENRLGLADRARQAPRAIAGFSPDAIGRKMVKALEELLDDARSQSSRAVPAS
jgi:glycosyltransferase involved in cell wall biosynthesis